MRGGVAREAFEGFRFAEGGVNSLRSLDLPAEERVRTESENVGRLRRAELQTPNIKHETPNEARCGGAPLVAEIAGWRCYSVKSVFGSFRSSSLIHALR